MKKLVLVSTKISAVCLALASLQCTSETHEGSIATRQSKMISIDAVFCDARTSTIVANTGNVIVNSGALVDSYDSSLGDYGGSNSGDDAVILTATSFLNNGGTVEGTVEEDSPAGFPAISAPSDAINLPLGAATPGSLNINNAAESITLEPGDYVVNYVNINAGGALDVAPGGEVRIWVTGGLNLGGEVNEQGTPGQLTFVLPNSGWVNLNGGQFSGLLYAPTSNVNVNGSVFGTVVGKSVTINSGGSVHFDVDSTCEDPSGVVLDQSFTTPGGLTAGLYGPGALMAQTFTAGITGTLQGAAISVNRTNPNFVARIQVRTVENGEPSDTVLGEGFTSSGGDLDINTVIEFTSPIPQVAGEQYALVVNYPDAPPFVDNAPTIGNWVGSSSNDYPAGILISTLDGGDTWVAGDDFDLLFQTFVIPD